MSRITDRRLLLSTLTLKFPVRVATTAPIALSGLLTVDGITVDAGDRVLVKDQDDGAENGIYNAKSGTWNRAQDWNDNTDFVQFTRIYVGEGATFAGYEFQLTTASPSLGTTALTFAVASRLFSALDGTVALPSITFDNDPDTGLYRTAANSLGLTAGGDLQLRAFSADGISGGLTQPRIGGLWTDAPNFRPTPVTGVNIARFERVLVGAAGDNDGTKPVGGVSVWLDNYDPFIVGISELAVVAHNGLAAMVGAVRTSDSTNTPGNAIAGSFYAVNDNTSQLQVAYGIYVEAFRPIGAGTIHGMEIDATEFGTSQAVLPYTSSFATMSNALWLASGGGNEVGTTDASLALGIINNGAKFRRGIVFMDDSLTGTDGVTGSGEAIVMAKGHQLNWYYAGDNAGLSIYSMVDAANDRQFLLFDVNGMKHINNTGAWNFRSAQVPGTITGNLVAVASITAAPELQAEGSATDVSLGLRAKGTGSILLHSPVSGPAIITTGLGVSTGDCVLEVGGHRSGDGNSYIDFHAASATDFEARILRQAGANGTFLISNTGSGSFQFDAANASAVIQFLVNSAEAFRADGSGLNLASGKVLRINSTQVVGARGAAVPDAAGGATVDAEARTAINTLLARVRTHGLIST